MSNLFPQPASDPDPDAFNHDYEDIQRFLGWVLLAAIAIVLIIVNLVTPGVCDDLEDSIPAVILLGVCIAQVNLISIWGVMASGRLLLRLPWALALLAAAWYSLTGGMYVANESSPIPTEVFQVGWCLMLGFACGMATLGAITWAAGWKIDRKHWNQRREQMSVRLLLAGMTLIGLFLAVGRWIVPTEDISWKRVLAMDGGLYAMLIAVIIVNVLQTTPTIWIAFLPRKYLLTAAAGLLVYLVPLTLGEILALVAFLGSPPDFYEVLRAFFFINFGQVVTVFVSLCGLRLVGFELRRRGGFWSLKARASTSPFASEAATQINIDELWKTSGAELKANQESPS